MNPNQPERILFVYNADGNAISKIKDNLHKIFRPSTYECNLCAVSFGNLGMRSKWKEFIESSPIPVEFLHQDEFVAKYPQFESKFPVAYYEQPNKLSLFISAGEMNQLASEQELIDLVSRKLSTLK